MDKSIIENDWKKHLLKINNEIFNLEDNLEERKDWRSKIEPWLTAIFQSEHLSLLLGSGLVRAATAIAGSNAQGMDRIDFQNYTEEIKTFADETAKKMDRGIANFEDDLRTAISLLEGLQIMKDEKSDEFKKEINEKLSGLIDNILNTEVDFLEKKEESRKALNYLKSFLISAASRVATRDRLNIFTTNYDRFIEYSCDNAGIFILDHFVGKINPVFRKTKLELDYHYNPPGIRGEPRYVEGVIRFTKLHGSIDWQFKDDEIMRKPLEFGVRNKNIETKENILNNVVVYPNSQKGIEISFYPYSELFRELASAVCRPNSSVVTYGYGFGDSHINHILKDMLNIPSTHLVIISYDGSGGRIKDFLKECNLAQITLLIGNHFGNLQTLIDNYMPKPAIDRLTEKMIKNKEKRGLDKLVLEKNKKENNSE